MMHLLLLDTATWPCQVKESKIMSEPSLLTGWPAVQLANCVVNLVSNFPITVRHNPGTRLRLLSPRAAQKVYTHAVTYADLECRCV